MDKTLQDLAWSVLPKEFKEEVKRMWSVEVDCTTKYKSELHKHRTGLLYELFGEHLHWQNNLTSDAEGEEMLACEKSRVQQQYKRATQLKDDSDPKCALVGDQMEQVLLGLFGSKCLPDELTEDNFGKSEPKFKVGDTASYVCSPTLKHKCTVTKVMQNEHSRKWEYNVMFEWGKPGMYLPESDLEPYTEPKAGYLHADGELVTSASTFTDNRQSLCKSQRLQIAAMAMQGILSNADRMKQYGEIAMRKSENLTQLVARNALRYADALVAEAQKGGEK